MNHQTQLLISHIQFLQSQLRIAQKCIDNEQVNDVISRSLKHSEEVVNLVAVDEINISDLFK